MKKWGRKKTLSSVKKNLLNTIRVTFPHFPFHRQTHCHTSSKTKTIIGFGQWIRGSSIKFKITIHIFLNLLKVPCIVAFPSFSDAFPAVFLAITFVCLSFPSQNRDLNFPAALGETAGKASEEVYQRTLFFNSKFYLQKSCPNGLKFTQNDPKGLNFNIISTF